MPRTAALAIAAMLAVVPACGGDDDALGVAADCNPLGLNHCMTPWPSSVFAVDDATTATGRRLNLGAETLPDNADGYFIAPDWFNERDGFSPAAPMIMSFPGGVDPSNLVHYYDYADSLTDASPTVLINMDTGERVAHFAELDAPTADEPDRQALYIRPATRLDGSTRYAAGIRTSLKSRDGGELPISAGWQSLLDGTDSGNDRLEAVRPRYDDIFAAFEAEGISRDDLVVAWDFTTVSDDTHMVDMLAARDRAMALFGTAGENMTFEVTEMSEHSDPDIAYDIKGTFTTPLFLTNNGAFAPRTILARGADGLPEAQGMYEVTFRSIVPECALSAAEPVPIMLYGHGLFGDDNEVASGATRDAAAEVCAVVVGTDWRGMSARDIGAVARALNNLNFGDEIFETLVQGIVNFIGLEHIARGPLAEGLWVDEQNDSYVDPTRVYYYGLSQGGIFGTTFMAYDPFIERGVVGVGAINYSLMLERSSNWPTYRLIMAGAYQDKLDVAVLIGVMQMMWDATDPVGTAHIALEPGAIPGTPDKQLIMQIGVADNQVPNVASEYQARTMGIPVLGPAPYEPYLVPETTGPLDGSALVIFDGGLPAMPTTNTPPQDLGAHSMPRSQPAAWRQMAEFFSSGTIVHTCGETACWCSDGACN